jgi:hypothetical protein
VTDVIILKMFSPKILTKILAFFCSNYSLFSKNVIITLIFEKNANFAPKIGTSTQTIMAEKHYGQIMVLTAGFICQKYPFWTKTISKS